MAPTAAIEIINLTPQNIGDYGVCGYKDAAKHLELRNKIAWYTRYYPKGLRIKAVMSKEGGYQGMLEYVPGEYAHRPVDAAQYLFIHCLFVGFKKAYKGQGLASHLLQDCVDEARAGHYQGVAVVARKGPFMAHSDIFLKHGFEVVDSAKPDFDLLALKFEPQAPNPQFRHAVLNDTSAYAQGLTVMRSFQCPYTEKNVKAILQSAEEEFHLQATLVDLADAQAAQNVPSPFGTFCLIYNGEILSHHPISNTRFANIMRKKLS
ncbi:MAG: hypothetical protein PWQ55_1314 [Chloroflexota bacterium]|nr:hypothetical protein [Chloroflexota bacterium]